MDYITYDDDCSVCSKFARFLKILTAGRVPIFPMHDPKVIKAGYSKIGSDEYWKSFHVISNGKWYTEEEAIVALARLLPFGFIGYRVAGLLKKQLLKLLGFFQQKRKLECQVRKQPGKMAQSL